MALVFLLLALLAPPPGRADTTPVRVSVLGPVGWNDEVWAGLLLTLDAGWKTYWRDPGASGLAPQLIDRATQDTIALRFPPPERFDEPGGDIFGYDQEVLLTFRLPQRQDPSDAPLPFTFDFAVCNRVCLPLSETFSLAHRPKPSAWDAKLFARISQADAAGPPPEILTVEVVEVEAAEAGRQCFVRGQGNRYGARIEDIFFTPVQPKAATLLTPVTITPDGETFSFAMRLPKESVCADTTQSLTLDYLLTYRTTAIGSATLRGYEGQLSVDLISGLSPGHEK